MSPPADFEDTENRVWKLFGTRWGHSWHSMAPYLGSFPPELARSFIELFTTPGDTIIDPFCGRGTTLLEARLSGRYPIASDLNPIAVALTRAKNESPDKQQILGRIEELGDKYDPVRYLPEAQAQPESIHQIYHPRTLAQLCFLRRRLKKAQTDVDRFLVGSVLGIMHGSERQDGSSLYASISMPNTFSMSPDYVKKYVSTNRLKRVERNVFELLATKIDRLYRDPIPDLDYKGLVAATDATQIHKHQEISDYSKPRLVVTSPPYLNVVNYSRQNWIRRWFLEGHNLGEEDDLADSLVLPDWIDFVLASLQAMKAVSSDDAVVVLVVGDVLRTGGVLSLARELLRAVHAKGLFSHIGVWHDAISEGQKTTRIWNDTKGRATEVDRILLLSDRPFRFDYEQLYSALAITEETDIRPVSAGDVEKEAAQFASL